MTLSEDQTAGWVLSYHLCNIMNHLMDNNMFSDVHKEGGGSRRKLDAADRQLLRTAFNKHTHPFKATTESPINIINGCVADKNVNVHNAVTIGQQIVAEITASLPAGFYKSLRSRVITMETAQKGLKVGDKTVFDIEKLYGRMMVIAIKRNLTLKVVFSHELCPFPASLFDSYCHMRNPDTKSLLVKLLAVYTDTREKPDMRLLMMVCYFTM